MKAFVLADGTVLSISNAYKDIPPLNIYVDVNGQKGPNIIGYDLWSMSIFYDGVVDESSVTPEARKEEIFKRLEKTVLTTYARGILTADVSDTS